VANSWQPLLFESEELVTGGVLALIAGILAVSIVASLRKTR